MPDGVFQPRVQEGLVFEILGHALGIRRHDTLGLQYPGFLFHHVTYRPRKGRSRYYLTDHRANILRAAGLPTVPVQSVSPAVRCLWRVPAGSAGSGCRTILSAGRIPDGVPSFPLLHSPIGNELPHDRDGLLTRLPGQSLEPEMQLRVVADGKAVFLPLGLAQDRAAALSVVCLLRCFHSFAISGEKNNDRISRPAGSTADRREGSGFWLPKTQPCLL